LLPWARHVVWAAVVVAPRSERSGGRPAGQRGVRSGGRVGPRRGGPGPRRFDASARQGGEPGRFRPRSGRRGPVAGTAHGAGNRRSIGRPTLANSSGGALSNSIGAPLSGW